MIVVEIPRFSDPSRAHVRVVFGGDLMLGRGVAKQIRLRGPSYPLGGILGVLRRSDLAVANLECALTTSTETWAGAPKGFYFGGPPQAVQGLRETPIRLLSLANNHLLDFGYEGLADTLRELRRNRIAYAGAGENLAEAHASAMIVRSGIRFGMVAFCDHQEDFSAGPERPGISYLNPHDEAGLLEAITEASETLKSASVHWPILSFHWGPNMVRRPAAQLVRIAHAAVDRGFGIVFGHSAHTFHGIELYRGRPILYSAGDLVDDYAVEPRMRTDLQILFEMEMTAERLHRVRLWPLRIQYERVERAQGEDWAWVAREMTARCHEFGTRLVRRDREGFLEVDVGAEVED
jgi:poly-gamma-glutamate capsule biosynthesis protein CapA/YwtB (metallophosphatase superfamily)